MPEDQVALRVCWPAQLARSGGEGRLTDAPRQTRRRDAADAAALNWPVVALSVCAIQCGRAHHELQRESEAPTGVLERRPVSVKQVEYVIKQAWRTRYPASPFSRVRHHERKALKQHAERVVAALRNVESRQYSTPSEALPELATMLLVIAERYAQGRVSQLLDDEQLADVQIVRDWAWLRLLFGGTLITVALVGVAQIGSPDTAVAPVVALRITLIPSMVYRGRLPGLGDLIHSAGCGSALAMRSPASSRRSTAERFCRLLSEATALPFPGSGWDLTGRGTGWQCWRRDAKSAISTWAPADPAPPPSGIGPHRRQPRVDAARTSRSGPPSPEVDRDSAGRPGVRPAPR